MKNRMLILVAVLCATSSLQSQNPLIIPDTLSGTSFELTLQNGTMQFFSGQTTSTMGVNGNILGPTLIMQKGDFVDITVENQIGETTTIHWHGMHVSASNDGGPHTTIEPGETWNPSFTVMDRAATYWYHPHLHEKTNEHVSKGIAGFIVIRDGEEAALSLPRTYGVDDFPLVVQTKDFDAANQVIVHSNSDDVLMVNATIDPVLDVPAQVVRLRLLNGSSQRVFNMGLSENMSFHQVASDGGLLSESLALTRLRLAPGERAEILVDFGGMEGQSIQLMSYAAEFQNGIYGATEPGTMSMMTLDGYKPNALNGNNFNIMKLQVIESTEDPVITIPGLLVELNPPDESSADITRNLSFTPSQMGPDQLNHPFLINNTSFDMDVINYSIPLDNIEVWSIFNQSGIAHPFHIHNVQFFVLDRDGVPPPESEQGSKDVILIEPMETIRFITQFTDFANDPVPYMLHCHMLVHEDDGMMLQFEVVDETTGEYDELHGQAEPKIYPNPVSKDIPMLHVSVTDKSIESYVILDLQGRLITKGKLESGLTENSISVAGIKSGVYFLRLVGNDLLGQTTFVIE